ncbi:hypothetical protein NDU88_001817 [Pleurodeles waltl]|uniref:Uncharacterized protein n=1 Tax=Pleurodeles waltl TaxID=8319 RepID=A0AAV7U9I2_PLEWA|nr:hypothetical protein NDU88_001817 [Pleurodeles waltl]
MAWKSTEHLDVEEEEISISIQGSDWDDSDADRPPTAGQHVSTPAPTQAHSQSKTTQKASGTPLPEGHGSTHKQSSGDQATPSAPKKATTASKSSDSSRDTVSEKARHRVVTLTVFWNRGLLSAWAFRCRKNWLRIRKKPHILRNMDFSKQMKERHRFEEELHQIEEFETQARIQIHKDTGKIQTAPPLKFKRKLAFQGRSDTEQPKAKVPREQSPQCQFSPAPSPHSPQRTVSPLATPTAQSPTHCAVASRYRPMGPL